MDVRGKRHIEQAPDIFYMNVIPIKKNGRRKYIFQLRCYSLLPINRELNIENSGSAVTFRIMKIHLVRE